MADKKYTRKQVEELAGAETAFVINNLVYNVEKFLDEHPGGHEVLVNVKGKDATEDFNDIGHSTDAKELMKKYQVGEIVEAERIEVKKRQVKWDADKTEESSFLNSWKFPVLVGIIITVLYSYLLG